MFPMKPFTEKEIVTAISFIARRPNSDGGEGVGMTCPDLQAFMKRVRQVKGEFTDALLNKMFYAATPRSTISVDELAAALNGPEFGQGWYHVIGEALRASSKPQAHKNRDPSTSPRQSTYLSPRRVAVQAVVDAAQNTKTMAPLQLQQQAKNHESTSFPRWSVHTDERYNDAFDKVRVDRNGTSLETARKQEREGKKAQLQRIHPNEYGAVVVPRSPRNEGYAVVVVDATAEKERMRRAMYRQGVLKKLLNKGGASVEKYLRNELSIGDNAGPIHPRDLSYRNTMTAIVDFLSTPSSPRGATVPASPRA